jgi:ubiquinone/menaquinone biosynthesis C-methylase UbiE
MNIKNILKVYKYNKKNKIYENIFNNKKQRKEIKSRQDFNKDSIKKNFMNIVSQNHSIEVMDREIENNVYKKLPMNSLILDVGGGWCWHWRNISNRRPDIKIIVVDITKTNFVIAKQLIYKSLNKNIFLVNDDITQIKINKSEIFNLVWSSQTLQHVPEFKKAIINIHKLLKKNSCFINYSLNKNNFLNIFFNFVNIFYKKKNSKYQYCLEKFSDYQKDIISNVFIKKNFRINYSEIIFNITNRKLSGLPGSFLGKIDAILTGKFFLLKYFSRQVSCNVTK